MTTVHGDVDVELTAPFITSRTGEHVMAATGHIMLCSGCRPGDITQQANFHDRYGHGLPFILVSLGMQPRLPRTGHGSLKQTLKNN